MRPSHTMKGRTPKLNYTKEELDKIRHAIKVADAYIDKKIKGLKIEANEKEKVNAAMLKEEIVEWLKSSGKYEQAESIKEVPITLLRQAIGAVKIIADKRSINSQIEYLKTYKQIDQNRTWRKTVSSSGVVSRVLNVKLLMLWSPQLPHCICGIIPPLDGLS